MIQQVIVVEGKSDIARVRQAVDADLIATGGYALRSAVIQDIRVAYEKRGIIILTDPDGPGEKIRSRLSVMFPEALHAFVPKSEASTEDDVGIENASPESIRKALDKVRILYQESSHERSGNPCWQSAGESMKDANLADIKVVRYVLQRFGIRAKHRLGQNFLVRPDIVAEIAAAAELAEGAFVLEIGAGIGTLTQALAETGANVTTFEIDKSLENVLTHTLEAYNNVHIIYEDVLKANLKEILGDNNWHAAANLPYYITTPILLYLIQSELPISLFVFMMQKEVADRILAKAGSKDYGALTLAVQFGCTVERVMDIPPAAFLPHPAVTSTVLKIRRRKEPAVKVADRKLFFRLVKMGFGQRRKVFTNAMKSGGISMELGKKILERAGIDGGRRGETFSMEEYAALANAWDELVVNK